MALETCFPAEFHFTVHPDGATVALAPDAAQLKTLIAESVLATQAFNWNTVAPVSAAVADHMQNVTIRTGPRASCETGSSERCSHRL